jgi:hypothetical protein
LISRSRRIAAFNLLRIVALVVTTTVLCSCGSARGPQFSPALPPSPEQALIYVYAQPTNLVPLDSAGYDCGLALDRRDIGWLRPLGYTYVHVTPGFHILDSWLGTYRYPPKRIQEDLVAGQTYYYRFEVTGYPGTRQWTIRSVSPQEAHREIVAYRYQPNTYGQPQGK